MARAGLIAELLDKVQQFDEKYDGLRKFVQESNDLLEKEKPVGESAARIEEQMKTCQVGCIIELLRVFLAKVYGTVL